MMFDRNKVTLFGDDAIEFAEINSSMLSIRNPLDSKIVRSISVDDARLLTEKDRSMIYTETEPLAYEIDNDTATTQRDVDFNKDMVTIYNILFVANNLPVRVRTPEEGFGSSNYDDVRSRLPKRMQAIMDDVGNQAMRVYSSDIDMLFNSSV